MDDWPNFAKSFEELCRQLQRTPDAERAKSYFKALRVYPLPAVLRAGDQLSRDAGRFFPTSATWADAADTITASEDREELRQLQSGEGSARNVRLLPAAGEDREAAIERRRLFVNEVGDVWPGVARIFMELPIRGERIDHCPACQDTGTRREDDAGFGRAVACGCRATNPTMVRLGELHARVSARRRRLRIQGER